MKDIVESYISLLIHYPRRLALLAIAIASVMAFGMGNLRVSGDIRIFFTKENPQLQALEEFEQTFSQQDILQFLVKTEQGDIFTASTLKLLKSLTSEGWKLPYSMRATSLASHLHLQADDDVLISDFLIPDDFGYTDKEIAGVRDILNEDSLLKSQLLSPNADAAVVIVNLLLPKEDLTATKTVMQHAEALKSKMMAKFPGHVISISGAVAMNAAFGEAIERDLEKYIGFSYLVIIIALYVLLKSILATLATILLVGLSVTSAFGALGWFNIVVTPSIGLAPTMIMTIAVADAIHLLSSYQHYLLRGCTRENAVGKAIRNNALPIFITSVSTAIGFLILNFHESPPSRVLGNVVALGVLTAWIMTMVLLPAILITCDSGKPRSTLRLPVFMGHLSNVVIRHRKPLLIIISSLTLFCAYLAPKNQLVEDWNNQFDDSFAIKHAIDDLDSTLGGAHYIYYLLDTGVSNGITDPHYLQEVKAFSEWYLKQPEVTYVNEFSRTIERLNKALHNNEMSAMKIPGDQTLISQFLLLYGMSLPFGASLEDEVDIDQSATRMTVATRKLDSEQLIALDQRAQEWLKENASLIRATQGTGIDMIVAYAQQRNISSTVKTSIAALVIISCLLMAVFRSFYYGAISLIPNLAPAMISYGVWYAFVGEVNLTGALVMTMSLGIVVDDTVHFMTKYRHIRSQPDISPHEAIAETFQSVGVAIFITSLVLVLSFSITIGSSFQPTAYTGALMAMTLGFALVVDLLLLPALLLTFDTKRNQRVKK